MESRPCIDDLKNKETIIDLEMKIAKIEVKLDHVKLNKESVLKSIESKDNIISNAKKSEIESQNFETLENDLDQLEKQLKKIKEEKHRLESIIFKLQEKLKDEVRMGMVDLYHQSKKDYEDAHNHWLSCQQDLIEAKELLKKRKKKLETIKHFIRIEWEC